MNIFEINEKVLKDCRGHLYEHILKQEIPERENDLVITHNYAKDGNKYMTISSDSKTYRLNSNYKPVEEAKRWARSCFEDNNIVRVISVYGLGNGYFIRELCNKCDEKSILLVYEPFISVFLNVIKEYDISDIISSEKVFLYVGKEAFKDFSEIYSSLIGIMNIDVSYEIFIPYYNKIIQADYDFFVTRIWGYKAELVSTINTAAKLGRLFMDNICYSINNIIGASYISELKGKFPKDAPAIIVAAGPSLNKNILGLKKLKNKAFIVATDAAYKSLLCNDVVPDVVISCDPIKMWENDHKDFHKVPLICSFECNYKMKELHKGKRFYFGGQSAIEDFIFKIIEKNMRVPLSGSVATMAVSMCVEFGFNKIVLVGQDLAYGDDGQTHVDHSEALNDTKVTEVEGIYGGMVKTRPDWLGYISALKEMIYINSHIEYIDATEGGALLEGAKIMKLSEVAERFKNLNYNYEEIFAEASITFNGACKEKIDIYKGNLFDSFEGLKEKLKKAIKYCNRILDSVENDKYDDKSYEVKEVAKLFNEVHGASGITYIQYYCMQDIKSDIQDSNKGMQDEKSTWMNHYQCYKNVFEAYINSIPKIKELLNKDYSQEQ